jgi:hypothetical protein
VPTLTCRILFVFVVLAHDRRRILHVSVTPQPTSASTRQQLREAFPNDPNARFLLHDRDTTFDAAFGRAVEAFGVVERSPFSANSLRWKIACREVVAMNNHFRPAESPSMRRDIVSEAAPCAALALDAGQ